MDSCCHDKACELEQLRERQGKTLWIVLTINGVMFGVEMVVGIVAGSVALLADSLDMFGDTLVYGFSLYALHKSDLWRARSALLKGGIMAVFGLGVLAQCSYKVFVGTVPEAPVMGAVGLLALAANASCLVLLTRHKADDLNMRSTWLCSRNDIIANTSVIVAAILVAFTQSFWPDVAVSLMITILFLKSSWYVVREARAELQQLAGTPVQISMLPLTTLQTACLAGTCPTDRCQCG